MINLVGVRKSGWALLPVTFVLSIIKYVLSVIKYSAIRKLWFEKHSMVQ